MNSIYPGKSFGCLATFALAMCVSCSDESTEEPISVTLEITKTGEFYDSTFVAEHNKYRLEYWYSSPEPFDDTILEVRLDGEAPWRSGDTSAPRGCQSFGNRLCFAAFEFKKDSAWAPDSIFISSKNFELRAALDFPGECRIVSPSFSDTFSAQDDIPVRVEGDAEHYFLEFDRSVFTGCDTIVDSKNFLLTKEKYVAQVPFELLVHPFNRMKMKIPLRGEADFKFINMRNRRFYQGKDTALYVRWTVK